jgi:hypothetical protein
VGRRRHDEWKSPPLPPRNRRRGGRRFLRRPPTESKGQSNRSRSREAQARSPQSAPIRRTGPGTPTTAVGRRLPDRHGSPALRLRASTPRRRHSLSATAAAPSTARGRQPCSATPATFAASPTNSRSSFARLPRATRDTIRHPADGLRPVSWLALSTAFCICYHSSCCTFAHNRHRASRPVPHTARRAAASKQPTPPTHTPNFAAARAILGPCRWPEHANFFNSWCSGSAIAAPSALALHRHICR